MTDVLERQLKDITDPLAIQSLSQGAEALVYTTNTHPYLPDQGSETHKYIIKYRPPKPYRHPTLDGQLTKHRTLAEARILQKLQIIGVNVPKLIYVDPRKGVIWMEYIYGKSVKQWIWDEENAVDTKEINGTGESAMVKPVLVSVGRQIAKLHLSDLVHGDLTTSNIMLTDFDHGSTASLKPVLIDFGLASQAALAEDKAVDLYVLERAVESTHPVHSDTYNQWLLSGYLAEYDDNGKVGKQKAKEVIAKLEKVRLRGRKRSMVG
ncbi:serine/threonine protein kinase BUD32 [Sugiyamaella lignohabitans]|uniref:EKC/KEOPS complex subunit BUD32 n=1 Tax=Sugiyamaella lignohabitans TaxID=796027 RepID=A0A161HGP8_9ASCO|nr:serine/threonine protein kinase BUD32 [Sugiyamaella lignohabitans]ANB14960.1 serine/threonine protein kinase BUD32 [Sugiyamaella lignohabitans]